jgi:hypothetical protein
MGKSAINPIEAAKLWKDMLVGLGAHQKERSDASVEAALKGDVPEAVWNFFASAIPGGPTAADITEQALGGDVAGAAGKTAGIALPFGGPAKNILGRLGKRAASSAESTLISLIKPKKGSALTAIETGAKDISKGLGVSAGKSKLLTRAESHLEKAGRSLDDAYNLGEESGKTVDLGPAAKGVRDVAKEIEVPKVGDFLEFPGGEKAFKNASVAERQAFIKNAQEQATAQTEAITTLYPERLAAANEQANRIAAINKQFGGKVPIKTARKIMQGAGDRASDLGAFGKLQTETSGAQAVVSKTAQSEISSIIKAEVPGVAKASLKSSQWQSVRDALYAAIEAEKISPKVPAIQILATRLGMSAGVGALGAFGLGGELGGAVAVASTAYGMFQVGRELLQSPLWRSASASTKYAIADALAAGGVIDATVAGARAIDENLERSEREAHGDR